MKSPDILTALGPVIDAFKKLGVSYYIGGSVASSAYGIARATLDVDLVADLKSQQVKPLVKSLESEYFIDEEMITGAIHSRTTFNLIHLETMLKVDVFILKEDLYSREAFQRKKKDTLDEQQEARQFYLASPEDVLLSKLKWFRMGGDVSEQQWRDVLGVLKVQADLLDMGYLRKWATALKVADLLEQGLRDAGM